ncbi:MAG TPA: polyphenol oxidase family protein [Gemmatimonadales bacterium]
MSLAHPAREVAEQALPGPVPRFVLDDWQQRFGIVAGITARGDGAGRGFDLGLWTDAAVGEVMARWRAFRAAEPGFGAVVLGNQVHRTEVVWHERADGWVQLEGVDGHATAAPGVLLTVTVADCIPVYLAAPAVRAVALLHAGWRGSAAGILERGLRLLTTRAGCTPGDVVMHCGIGICGECYEVGSEVLEGFGLRGDGRGPWRLDIRERLVDQADGLGIREITTSSWCTAHHRPLFYSHRASGGRDGRMVAYIGVPRAS